MKKLLTSPTARVIYLGIAILALGIAAVVRRFVPRDGRPNCALAPAG